MDSGLLVFFLGFVILVIVIFKFSKPEYSNCKKRNSIEVDRYQSIKRVIDVTKK